MLVLGFFDQLIIIVLCSFDSKQFPEIKKMLFPNFFSDVRLASMLQEKTQRGDGDRSTAKTIHRNFSSICYHFNDFPFYSKKWYHFHSNEVRSRAAQHYHLPIDDYANSYTVHRCNKRKKHGWRKRLLGGPESLHNSRGMALGFFRVRPL